MATEVGILTRDEIEAERPIPQTVPVVVSASSAGASAVASVALLDEPPTPAIEMTVADDDEDDEEAGSLSGNGSVTSGAFTQISKSLAFPGRDAPMQDIAAAVLKIVTLDGPLPKASIYRLYVLGCPNIARAARTVRSAVNRALHWLDTTRQIAIVDEGRWRKPNDQVVRLAGTNPVSLRERGQRQPEDIPLGELAERLRQAGALTLKGVRDREKVLREAQRTAGFDRMGSSVRKRLEAAWTLLEAQS
jgi:hypothetical protein